MRVVVQRVSRASVTINGQQKAAMGRGLLILLGIEEADDVSDVQWMATKLLKLRLFPDNDGVMNLSVQEVNGNLLVVSQFTLHASTKKGNRPSYIRAARPEKAIPLYEAFIRNLQDLLGKEIFSGTFGAMMEVELVNEGPVTIWIDSRNKE